MSIIVKKLNSEVDLAQIFELVEAQRLLNGWNIENAPEVYCYLAASELNLYYAAEMHAQVTYNKENQALEYVAGLWEEDVLELFIKDIEGDSYQEFNLSPSGSYWSMYFKECRVADEASYKKFSSIDTFSEVKTEYWRAAIKIPLRELSVNFQLSSEQKLNSCAIYANQHFYSFSELWSEQPDFHRPECFEKIKFD